MLRFFIVCVRYLFFSCFDFLCVFPSCWADSLDEVLIAWQAKIVDNRANSSSSHTASWSDANLANMEPFFRNILSFQVCIELHPFALVAFLYGPFERLSPSLMSSTKELENSEFNNLRQPFQFFAAILRAFFRVFLHCAPDPEHFQRCLGENRNDRFRGASVFTFFCTNYIWKSGPQIKSSLFIEFTDQILCLSCLIRFNKDSKYNYLKITP